MNRYVVLVTLKYKEKEYTFPFDFGESYSDLGAGFLWTEGNYSCDCNRSLFIGRYANSEFEDMKCGDKIELVSLFKVEVGKSLL